MRFSLLCILLWLSVVGGAILRTGRPLKWVQSKPFLHDVRIGGIQQFLSHYNRCKGVKSGEFLWGDEIEFGIFKQDCKLNRIDIATNAGTPIRSLLSERENEFQPTLHGERSLETAAPDAEQDRSPLVNGCEWQPEYGSWMVEAVPRYPFGADDVGQLMQAEQSMQLRRKRLHSALSSDELAPTMSVFPMLGVAGYNHSAAGTGAGAVSSTVGTNSIANSQYISDHVINPHPRFGALTANIRQRRGSNVDIVIAADADPYDRRVLSSRDRDKDRGTGNSGGGDNDSGRNEEDLHTASRVYSLLPSSAEVVHDLFDKVSAKASRNAANAADAAACVCDGSVANGKGVQGREVGGDMACSSVAPIHMDAMAFGMGCCCLQVTLQLQSEAQSRFVHDQLEVLSPLLHALTAATPLLKGRLAASDTRWGVISQAVDDRTPAERGGGTPGLPGFPGLEGPTQGGAVGHVVATAAAAAVVAVAGEEEEEGGAVDSASSSPSPSPSLLPLMSTAALSSEPTADPELVGRGVKPLSQSRYSQNALFIGQPSTAAELQALRALNDLPVAVDEESYRLLREEGGVDESLARHVAHLFTRDPLVIFDDAVHIDNENRLVCLFFDFWWYFCLHFKSCFGYTIK
jgi:hypothetical protein